MSRAGLALAIIASLGAAGATYRTGPPPGHTGAFGEPDCGVCHFDAGDEPGPLGSLTIRPLGPYAPGEAVTLVVVLEHPDMAAAGFQLTARYAREPNAGGQAGSLAATTGRVAVERNAAGVIYASHTVAGTELTGPGRTVWSVRWTAPEDDREVAIDVAAQASNDDNSEFGERLYRARRVHEPRLPRISPVGFYEPRDAPRPPAPRS